MVSYAHTDRWIIYLVLDLMFYFKIYQGLSRWITTVCHNIQVLVIVWWGRLAYGLIFFKSQIVCMHADQFPFFNVYLWGIFNFSIKPSIFSKITNIFVYGLEHPKNDRYESTGTLLLF